MVLQKLCQNHLHTIGVQSCVWLWLLRKELKFGGVEGYIYTAFVWCIAGSARVTKSTGFGLKYTHEIGFHVLIVLTQSEKGGDTLSIRRH